MGLLLKKILVIRLSAMGDVVLTSHLLRCIKLKHPQCQIDFLEKGKNATFQIQFKNILEQMTELLKDKKGNQ